MSERRFYVRRTVPGGEGIVEWFSSSGAEWRKDRQDATPFFNVFHARRVADEFEAHVWSETTLRDRLRRAWARFKRDVRRSMRLRGEGAKRHPGSQE